MNDASGKSIGEITGDGFGGLVLAVFSGIIVIWQAIITFVVSPITGFADAMGALVQAFVKDPLMVIPLAAEITAAEISIFGIFALPAGVAIVLVTFFIIGAYLRYEQTSDFLPGTRFDLPTDTLGADEDER